MTSDKETCFTFDFAPSHPTKYQRTLKHRALSASRRNVMCFFGLSHMKRNCVRRSHYNVSMSLKLSRTVQFHFLKAGCFHFKGASVSVSKLRVDVRELLLQLICIHGSIREGFKTNDTLGQLLLTSLYESESIVEKSIVIFSLSFSHSFLCN